MNIDFFDQFEDEVNEIYAISELLIFTSPLDVIQVIPDVGKILREKTEILKQLLLDCKEE